jgi:hypothetical protein
VAGLLLSASALTYVYLGFYKSAAIINLLVLVYTLSTQDPITNYTRNIKRKGGLAASLAFVFLEKN